jgi:hypothetical protein
MPVETPASFALGELRRPARREVLREPRAIRQGSRARYRCTCARRADKKPAVRRTLGRQYAADYLAISRCSAPSFMPSSASSSLTRLPQNTGA